MSCIISLSIFSLIGKGINFLFIYNKYNLENNDLKFTTYLKIYLILILEFIAMFIIVFLCSYL